MQLSQTQETRLFEPESPKFDSALCYALLTREQAADGSHSVSELRAYPCGGGLLSAQWLHLHLVLFSQLLQLHSKQPASLSSSLAGILFHRYRPFVATKGSFS